MQSSVDPAARQFPLPKPSSAVLRLQRHSPAAGSIVEQPSAALRSRALPAGAEFAGHCSKQNCVESGNPRPRGGELGGNRTHDPRLKRALLYQLSYELVSGRCFQTTTAKVATLERRRATWRLRRKGISCRVFPSLAIHVFDSRDAQRRALIHGNQYCWYHGTHRSLKDRLPIGEKSSHRAENEPFRLFRMAGKC